jgi:outer membrane protein TolC
MAIEHRVTVAQEGRLAAEATRRPQVAVGGGVDYARPNPKIFPRARQWDDSWDAGISVSWSLWDGGRAAAEKAQASYQGEAARQHLAEFDATLDVELRQRSLEIVSGEAAVSAADEAIRAATEARRVVGERYRAGVIAQSEVLDAELTLVQVQLDRTRALANVRLAEARLDRALGR